MSDPSEVSLFSSFSWLYKKNNVSTECTKNGPKLGPPAILDSLLVASGSPDCKAENSPILRM